MHFKDHQKKMRIFSWISSWLSSPWGYISANVSPRVQPHKNLSGILWWVSSRLDQHRCLTHWKSWCKKRSLRNTWAEQEDRSSEVAGSRMCAIVKSHLSNSICRTAVVKGRKRKKTCWLHINHQHLPYLWYHWNETFLCLVYLTLNWFLLSEQGPHHKN